MRRWIHLFSVQYTSLPAARNELAISSCTTRRTSPPPLKPEQRNRPSLLVVGVSVRGKVTNALRLDLSSDPCQGIVYLLSHPFLWPVLRARFILCFFLSVIVLVLLFLFTYLPQVAFLAIFQGHFAWVHGAILVLGEGAAIVAILFEAFFVDEALVEIFDAVRFSFALTLTLILLLLKNGFFCRCSSSVVFLTS